MTAKIRVEHRPVKFGLIKSSEYGEMLGWLTRPVFIHGEESIPHKPELRYAEGLQYPLLRGDVDCISKIDWLRVSFRGREALHLYHELVYLLNDLLPDLQITHSTKKMLGYSETQVLTYWQDNTLHQIGFIGVENDYTSSNVGLVLDLSGIGCGIVQANGCWRELVDFCSAYSCSRITRADIALDLDAGYCKARNLTIPKIGKMAKDGLFAMPNSRQTSSAVAGDWSQLIFGDVAIEDYNPDIHALGGLTYYHGKRTSPVFIRAYEKGKEIMGRMIAEGATVGDVSEIADHKWWARIEFEFKRDKDGNDIPFELLLEPDVYMIHNRAEFAALYHDYAQYLGHFDYIKDIKRTFRRRAKQLALTRKIHWARRQYGRLISTLLNLSLTDTEVIDILKSSRTLKDYINDIDDPI